MYVVTRWYRAPEVTLMTQNYDEGIDMWAVGCVFGELMSRQPMFPAKNHLQLVEFIQQFIGKLSEEDLAFYTEQASRDYIQKIEAQLGFKEQVPPHIAWKKRFPDASDQAIDLLSKLLSFNPKRRLTVQQAIQHEYFAQIIALETPPTSKVKFNWEWEYRNTKLLNSIPVVKKLIHMESLLFHPEEDQRQLSPANPPVAANEESKEAAGAFQSPKQRPN